MTHYWSSLQASKIVTNGGPAKTPRLKYGLDVNKPYAEALYDVVTSHSTVIDFMKYGLKPGRENARRFYEEHVREEANKKPVISWMRKPERELVERGCTADDFATAFLASLPTVVSKMVGERRRQTKWIYRDKSRCETIAVPLLMPIQEALTRTGDVRRIADYLRQRGLLPVALKHMEESKHAYGRVCGAEFWDFLGELPSSIRNSQLS